MNEAAERIFGLPREEVVGRDVSMLMPEPDRSGSDGYLSRYLAGGAPRIIGVGREVT
jgi:PAS domain S-box-containing protein